MKKSFFYLDSFYKNAGALRKYYDEVFANPRSTNSRRFVWDFWNLPGQYTHLRTPAYLFFPKTVYEPFHRALVNWGRENLGCHDISPTWLSCYTEGCEQKLHADLPHGPWAFVYSLTPSKQHFNGGRTQLLKESVLNYWSDFKSGSSSMNSGTEFNEIFDSISPKFNRLTVFDPRIPHGVERVSGIGGPLNDVTKGRLVMHGWFVKPKPMIIGPLSFGNLEKLIRILQMNVENILNQLGQETSFAGFESIENLQGTLVFRITVSLSGKITSAEVLTERLKGLHPSDINTVIRCAKQTIQQYRFPVQKKKSTLTLPLLFEKA